MTYTELLQMIERGETPTVAQTCTTTATDARKLARALCARRGIESSWTASASRPRCIAYITGDDNAAKQPAAATTTDTANTADAVDTLATTLRTLIASSLDAERVREIVREETGGSSSIDEFAVKAIVAAAIESTPIIKIQAVNGSVVKLDGPQHPIAKRVAIYCANGVRTWIHGPAGTGKTTLARALMEAAGMQVFVQGPAPTRYDILGHMDGHSHVVDTPTSRFIRATGPKGLIFDEVDAFGPDALLAANLMLANHYCDLPDGSHPISKDNAPLWVCATGNTTGGGATSEYTGRKRQDKSFRDRFDAFPLMDLHEPTETRIALAQIKAYNVDDDATAKATASIATSQRVRAHLTATGADVPWSPRKTYALARLVAHGDDVSAALTDMLSALPSDAMKAAIKAAQVA